MATILQFVSEQCLKIFFLASRRCCAERMGIVKVAIQEGELAMDGEVVAAQGE